MSISWYPLAGADPVPGDPWVVSLGGAHYTSVAEAIASASANLDRIVKLDGMQSEAVEGIRTKATAVAVEIAKVKDRYKKVGEALTTYAASLTTAQNDAEDLRRRAVTAQERIDEAGTAAYQADAALDQATTPAEQQARQTEVLGARTETQAASAALSVLQGDLEVVKGNRDRAAETAIDSIDDVVSSDNLNDGWWDDWGSKVANVVSDVAGIISTIAGIAALVLAWVPVLGAALAAVALIAGAIKLIADILLVAHGEGSWLDVGLGVLAIATFGVGRLAGTVFKAASKASSGLARIRAGQMASSMGNARTAITQLVGPKLGGISRQAAVSMSRPVTDAGKLVTTARQAVLQNPLADLQGGWRMLTNRAFAAEQWAAGKASFDGISGAGSWLLAQQGLAGGAKNMQLMTGVSDAVINSSVALQHAVTATNVSVVGVSAIAADGVRTSIDGAGDLFELVTDAFGPSTAEQLNLAR